MTDIERIEQRLSAVERTVTGEIDIDAERLQAVLALSGDVEDIEDRLEALEKRIATIEADVQSIGGYYSEVESVNEEVERHALSAVAAVDRLEDRVADLEGSVSDLDPATERIQRAVEQSVAAADATDEGEVPAKNGNGTDATGTGHDDNGTNAATTGNSESFPGQFRSASHSSDDRSSEAAGGSDGDDAPDGTGDGTDTTSSDRTPSQQRVDEILASTESGDSDENHEGEGVLERLRQHVP
ncbi:DUF7310 family coiled-coil domain-containing protein [Halorhabdus rudnickae]|uniref:DUF7310 family coiled-coil domain-containing protein n=1 Tax=Halorhabdus rudnickae TaxID=1775544 RepID=UPI001083E031|nr:hypothetical protein [Halorhabdus rudnickae]